MFFGSVLLYLKVKRCEKMSLSPRSVGSLMDKKNINLSKIQVSHHDNGRLGFLGGPGVEAIDLLT